MMPLMDGGMAPRNIACTIKAARVSGSSQSSYMASRPSRST